MTSTLNFPVPVSGSTPIAGTSAPLSVVVSKVKVPFSVLDLSPVGTDSSVGEALNATLSLAKEVEALGYHRFWLAEHHSMPGIASAAPAIMIGQVAAATERMRVGSGGVMLPNHAPLVVAEQFGTLDALFPGRIDLGIGRAPGTDQVTAHALRRQADPLSEDDFPQQLLQLRAFVDGGFPDNHPYRAITAVPGRGAEFAVWLLGSSTYSAQVAGLLGLPFAFARHFSPAQTMPALRTYRDAFRPSEVLDEPYAMVTVSVVAAESDERAEYLAAPLKLTMARLRAGKPGRFPSPEEAAANPLTPEQEAIVRPSAAGYIVGGPATVRRELAELLELTDASEIMVSTLMSSVDDRIRSYKIVRDAAPA
ncbi:LLM class flavin-dependent oxidoreductase [Antrihabitans sp. YC2-6]|uniref:LLM class flavin-dependent oxidoreductase n=1 Tax=Antrihabitans sp. YC2-6 TaxID=2799498 RepID=UPI0018F7A6AB|nr:LLM class flavin-dependent oxidoreductase [Antrihabitans sp. YC2-6]MBJ8348752.1 LLM class flavin-dependent oxidoreductase [Antrihabitans sp. YC2-6]